MKRNTLSLMALALLLGMVLQARSAAAADCELLHNGRIRCGFESPGTAKVKVTNVSGDKVAFTWSEWQSECNKPGSSIDTNEKELAAKDETIHTLHGLNPKMSCRELWLFNCRVNGKTVSCDGRLSAVIAQ
jgi:hypothetical protein